ncbi:DUF1724 domain-containing protein [Methanobrevibacter sp. OttesenSCG-928-K11]|nr:DUF1724 domain-containing protein [Methanobrevibacter sp. OttesenSCG-928-K11]MDL2271299.1 DUF1724 domain-containing protein [Methanobrevibacter sp. OttesenSCG-928-I08]
MKEYYKKEYQEIKYILTSSMRTKLIISIFEGSKNLENLRQELKKPSATILHGLKELENLNFVKKKNKFYSLSSNGYLLAVNMIKLIENWYSIDKNMIFWKNHYIGCIPEESLKNLYQLKDAKCIISENNDLSKPFKEYVNLIRNSENLKLILPIFSEIHLENIFNLLKNKNLEKIEIITNSEILESLESSKFKKYLKNNEKVEFIIIDKNLKIFLTCSNKFVSLSLFLSDGYYDDSQILIDESEIGIEWGLEIFNKYKYEK